MADSLGNWALPALLPPEALVDVNPERLTISRELCGAPRECYVVRNAPPVDSGWNVGPPARRDGAPRLVYAGSVTGTATVGLDLLLREIGTLADSLDFDSPKLAIYPAEGKTVAERRFGVCAADHSGHIAIHDRVDRDKLSTELAQYDVGVVLYPSHTSLSAAALAAPNKLHEYMAAGLAILATDNPSLDFVTTEGLGWNVSGTTDAMQTTLRALSRDRVEIFRRRAYKAFRERYNYEKQAASLIDWITAAVATGHARESVDMKDNGSGVAEQVVSSN